MKNFWTYLKISIKSKLYYRTSFILNMISPIIVLCGQVLLWKGIFKLNNASDFADMSRNAMFSYILIAFVLNNSLNWSTENSLSKDIRNGTVVSKMIRPTTFLSQNIADMFGGVLIQGLFYTLLVIVIFFIAAKDLFMPSFSNLLLFALSAILGMILRLMINDFFSLLCFFVTGYLGIAWLKNAITNFFSGAMIPITLFPVTLKSIAGYLPFKYMIQVPISIFLGEYTFADGIKTYTVQILWILFFIILHCLIYRKIRINLVIAGG